MVPVMVPDVVSGHDGWPPPPQKKTITPPLVRAWPRWMCAKIGARLRFSYVSVNAIDVLVSVSLRLAVPSVLIDGSSLMPINVARKFWPSSRLKATAGKPTRIVASASNGTNNADLLSSRIPTSSARPWGERPKYHGPHPRPLPRVAPPPAAVKEFRDPARRVTG